MKYLSIIPIILAFGIFFLSPWINDKFIVVHKPYHAITDSQWCKWPISFVKDYGLMIHGEINVSPEEYKPPEVWFVHITNPKTWDSTEYFTGTGWSLNEKDAMSVLEKDTCKLKIAWRQYLKHRKI